jgi:hypothetical protein
VKRGVIAAGLLAALALTACGGDSDDAQSDATPGVTAEPTVAATATVAPAESPAAQPTDAAPDGASAEVQGIVGSVDAEADAIIINRIGGASVKRVVVVSRTEIRDTRGNRLRLTQIRPSDRIIARGTVEGQDLIADEVEIGQVVPGTSPG